MWRQFLAEIATIGAVVTMLVTLGSAHVIGGMMPATGDTTGDLEWFCRAEQLKAEPSSGRRGYARLCIGDRSLRVSLEAEGLTPGDLYEGWLVYVDSSKECTAVPCPLPALLRGAPAGIFTRLGVASARDARRAHFTATFHGMTPAQGAQVQLLLVDRGPGIVGEGHIQQMLLTPWPPAGDEYPDRAVVARTHFTVYRVIDAPD